MRLLFSEVRKAAETQNPLDQKAVEAGMAEIRAHYFAVPLTEMQQDCGTFPQVLTEAADYIRKL